MTDHISVASEVVTSIVLWNTKAVTADVDSIPRSREHCRVVRIRTTEFTRDNYVRVGCTIPIPSYLVENSKGVELLYDRLLSPLVSIEEGWYPKGYKT